MNMRLAISICFLFIFSDACVDRYELPEKISVNQLVVEGMISDQPGPYTVKLYTAVNPEANTTNPTIIEHAAVAIVDDDGEEEHLEEISPGTYQTSPDGMRGEIGRTYYVRINIGANEYRSIPQEMKDSGFISKLYYSLEENVLNPGDPEKPHDAFDIYIDAEGFPDEQNLFRWRWSGIYELKTFPRLRAYKDPRSDSPIPDPPPCSGFVVRSKVLVDKVGPCTCCQCWAYEDSEKVLLSNNEYADDNNFKGVFVARVPIDHFRFNIRYFFKVEQLSVSDEVYNFWKLLKAQQDGEGSLFVPNSVKIRGNIRSLTHPDEEVLGIFSVSSITEKSMYFSPVDIQRPIVIDTVKDDCRVAAYRATTVRPPFW